MFDNELGDSVLEKRIDLVEAFLRNRLRLEGIRCIVSIALCMTGKHERE
jgi:hypothetical protein